MNGRESQLQKYLNRRFEDHTKEFIIRAQQRFEEKRKRQDAKIMNASNDAAVLPDMETGSPFLARLRRQVDVVGRSSLLTAPVTSLPPMPLRIRKSDQTTITSQ